MALDISGIDNVGEFYSHHYLTAVLEGDLKSVLKGWRDKEKAGDGRAPNKALAALAAHYFRCRNDAAEARSEEERWAAARSFHVRFLEVLGYPYSGRSEVRVLESGELLPLACALDRDGAPFLWVVDAPFPHRDEDEDDDGPFGLTLSPAQLPEGFDFDGEVYSETIQTLLDGPLFRQERAPRWVLYLAAGDAWLIEKHKWPQGKCLRFQLGELFGRRDAAALKAVAALLHRDVLAPDTGGCLHDTLDEKSHKHAFAVSTDLKKGVRKAVELLANEVVHYWKDVRRDGVYQRERDGKLEQQLDPKKLKRECLMWLYRLLFLFYAEARGKELGVVPMDSTTYRLGYSLESLRDLELVPLHTERARNGSYIHDSLKALFRILNRGYNQRRAEQLTLGDEATRDAYEAGDRFQLLALRSRLFDESETRLLTPAKLRNQVLQQILQLLSLSEGSRKRGRGRISYAQLGINQLGAVYEGLLSYSGFFAEEDLVEVKAKGDMDDPEARSYFVPKRKLGRYDDKEICRDDDGQQVDYPRGSFVFRLAGRDREKSASYYTPEVLTECLTRYTLMERLEGLSPDQILELTVCEPAMGSGAFLNEAVNQLADAYLERKQEELGETIPADRYQAEKQRVKYHFAVNNCYGVDLNPLAAELGKVSLWLNILHPGARAPFFDLRIGTGNSLMGGRREVFRAEHLTFKSSKKKGTHNWLDRVPERVPLGEARPQGAIWHFLLPDKGMAPFDKDKIIKALKPEAVAHIKAWRKDFTAPLTPMEVQTVERLSERVDALWDEHLEARRQLCRQLREHVRLWGQPKAHGTGLPLNEEMAVESAERVFGPPAAPGQRLARVMNAWCALWVWPLSECDRLPTRQQWFGDLERMLNGSDVPVASDAAPRLKLVQSIAERAPFFHWELAFPEAFADRGGFDIILGNPPWLKLMWKESGVLGDYEPLLSLRRLSAKQVADTRAAVLEDADAAAAYYQEFETLTGVGRYLNALQSYPLLKGVQTNLYKCFIHQSWNLGGASGVAAFLHQPGIFDDPKGGQFRAGMWPRLKLAALCKNQLKLFDSVHHERPYAWTVARTTVADEPGFKVISNLYHPKTLDASVRHDGHGSVPGIKDENGNWMLQGHRSRVVQVDSASLALFATLYDPPGTPPIQASLPVLHSQEILEALACVAAAPRLGPPSDGWQTTREWHEGDRQDDGTLIPDNWAPTHVSEFVFSGPHFFVGNPVAKSARNPCKHNQDYDVVCLVHCKDEFLPRSVYRLDKSSPGFLNKMPRWDDRDLFDYDRHINREMIDPNGCRTMIAAVAPAGSHNLGVVFTAAFRSPDDLLAFNGLSCSLPVDFFVKTTGSAHANVALVSQLPIPTKPTIRRAVIARGARLNCITTFHANLWRNVWSSDLNTEGFAKADPRLSDWTQLTADWKRHCALRTPFERRQALVELDALAALSLGLSADQLSLIYRVQFPVLQQYERETYYDQRGKIAFTVNKGLSGVGVSRKQWNEIKDAKAGDALPEWAKDQTGAFLPPFDRCDREADMRQAYAHFAERLKVSQASRGAA